jgi:hypothetical protein
MNLRRACVIRAAAVLPAIAALIALSGVLSAQGQPPQSGVPVFEKDVLPILKANQCLTCHGPNLKIKDMNLSTFQGVMQGSEGGPVVSPGKPADSHLFQMVHEGKMPPGGKAHVSEADVAVIEKWIEAGAKSASESVHTAAAEPVSQLDVVPIMLLRCTVCHGRRQQEGGLDLSSKDSMLKGGKSGPAIVLGQPDESLLIRKIRAGEMPPKRRMLEVGVKPITDGETDKVARWIAQGAPEVAPPADLAGTAADKLVTDKDRQFWAFQPPRRVDPPHVQHQDRVRNPIDAFVLQNLEEKGLTLSPEADKLTLLRRATFDVTGVPPDPGEIDAFLADHSPEAYEGLVDRLLASPRYGEHWARYWLDLAGYADSEGGKLSADHPRPYAWRYRDYVIRSFDADKPYDRFLLEQIAGDELVDYEHARTITREMMDDLIATGFLRMGPDSTSEREVNFVDDRLDVIADEIDVFSSGVLGLTMKCARCHSHKYDPLPQRDYYRLAAVFKGAYDEHDWLSPLYDKEKTLGRLLPYVDPNATPFELLEQDRHREERDRELKKQIDALKESLRQKAEPVKKKILDERLSKLPKPLQDDLRNLIATPADKRTEIQKYLAGKFDLTLQVEELDLEAADAGYRKQAEGIQKQIDLLEARLMPELRIQALWDRGEPSPTYILRRGSPSNFGQWVGPGVPAVLTAGLEPYQVLPPWPGAPKTGRRLALARWLIQPQHPLTSRVMVNRMWARHFGQGIVKTLGNFGHTGSAPTHPELLDWLATEFVRQGWSIKAMQRLILTSSTYRQSSTVTPAMEKADPDNLLLGRMPLKRLEAEELNDAILLVAGRLNETRFGPPDPVYVRDDGLITPLEIAGRGWRRSIYLQQRRSELPSMLQAFDYPAMSPACLERSQSNVAPQALQLLNDAMIRRLADDFAGRVLREAGPDPAKQVDWAFRVAVSRPPLPEEKKAALETLGKLRSAAGGSPDADRLALGKFCHTLLNSAAFLYVD